MSKANAMSSEKNTSFEKEVEKIKVVMGPFETILKDKEYALKMEPEFARSYSEPMMELAIPVGNFDKTLDPFGKVIKRVDSKTGKEFKTSNTRKVKTDKSDVEK